MALSGRRRGLFRVAGGFALTSSRVSVIATVRPGPIGWGVDREPDGNGYRGLRLGRLLVLLAHDLGVPQRRERWRRADPHARRPTTGPSVAERLAPYTHRDRP